MKTIKSTIIATALILGSNLTMAGENELQVMAGAKSGQYKVIYAAQQSSPVEIKVIDADKQVITSKKVNTTTGFLQPLDFSHMPTGKYFVEVYSGNAKNVVRIDHSQTSMRAEDFNITSVAGKLSISVAKASDNQLKLYLFDNESGLLHQEVVTPTNISTKKYDLSAVNSGTVTVILAENGETVLQKKIKL